MRLPGYIGEALKTYFFVSSKDRSMLLHASLFDLNTASCNTRYIQYLSDESGVDIFGLSQDEARAAIASASNHLWSGTAKSVRDAVGHISGVEIVESSEIPFVFSVNIIPSSKTYIYDKEGFDRISRLVGNAKNVRSIADGFNIKLPEYYQNIELYGGCTIGIGIDVDIAPFRAKTKPIIGGVIVWSF